MSPSNSSKLFPGTDELLLHPSPKEVVSLWFDHTRTQRGIEMTRPVWLLFGISRCSAARTTRSVVGFSRAIPGNVQAAAELARQSGTKQTIVANEKAFP